MPVVQANNFMFYQVNFDITLLGYGSYYEVDETVVSPATGAKFTKMSDLLVDLLQHPVGGTPYTDIVVLNHGYWKDRATAQADFLNWVNGLLPTSEQLNYNPLIVAPHWPSAPLLGFLPLTVTASQTDQQAITAVLPDSSGRPAMLALLQALLPFARANTVDTVLPDNLVAAFNAARAEAVAAGEPVPPVLASGSSFLGLLMEFFKLVETIGKDDLKLAAAAKLTVVFLQLVIVPSFAHFAIYGQIFGTSAVGPLVARLAGTSGLTITPRFHAMGHSLGTGVTAAMLAANAQTHSLPTFGLVFLAEGAISQWIFSNCVSIANGQPGLFMNMICDAQMQTVSGPVLSTLSLNDGMLAFGYQFCAMKEGWTGTGLAINGLELGDYAAIGLAGIAGPVLAAPGQTMTVQSQTLGQPQSYQAGQIYNLDGTAVISGHSDIYNLAVGQAFAEGLKVAIAALVARR